VPPRSRPQLAIYAALAVAVLLIGARVLRSQGGGSGAPGAGFGGAGGAADVALAPATTASGVPPDSAEPPPSGRLVVDVKGAVRRPGVYRLPAGARALDAVRRAGGLTGRADRIGVNLAARVVDGGELVVPVRGPGGVAGGTPTGTGSGTTAGAAGDASGAPLSLDLNTATEAELEQLDGVGPATAAKIVAYREQHGGIASIDELDNVSGIGAAKLAAIHAQLGR
jgi:competence protein ComEA